MVENRLPKPLLAGILLLLAVGLFFVGKTFWPQGEVQSASISAMEKDPHTKYMMDMATKCQGDFSKLSPEDQKDVIAKNGNNRMYAETFLKRSYVPGRTVK